MQKNLLAGNSCDENGDCGAEEVMQKSQIPSSACCEDKLCSNFPITTDKYRRGCDRSNYRLIHYRVCVDVCLVCGAGVPKTMFFCVFVVVVVSRGPYNS